MAKIQVAPPPALPFAPVVYSQTYQDQYSKVLRLFFNSLQGNLAQLSSTAIIPATTNFTVATLPGAAVSGSGARAFVSDALTPTFGATVVGGGAVAVPVYSDGTNWKFG
jgi:hypothetical protein